MVINQRIKASIEVVRHLAESAGKSPLTTKAFSQVTGLSISYLEVLCAQLRRAGFIDSVRGPGGGYVLSRSAEGINVLEIAQAFSTEKSEGDLPDYMGTDSEEAAPANALFERASIEMRSFMQRIRLSELLVQTESAPSGLVRAKPPSFQRESDRLTPSLD